MDRMGSDTIDQVCAYWRTVVLADDCSDLPPEERPTRAEIAPGCRLKEGDDVFCNGQVYRVVCPARGIGWFTGWSLDPVTGSVIGPIDAYQVTDRAPADPAEPPLPIFDPPTEEPPPESGTP